MSTLRLWTTRLGLCLTCVIPTAATAEPICPIDPCDPPEASCNSVCGPVTVAGKTIMVCELDDNDEASTGETDKDASGWAVYDDSDPGADVCESEPYCAWGTTTSGTSFYCEWDTASDTLTEVHLRGGSGDDQLSFLCESDINPAHSVYMQEWSGYNLSGTFFGRISGLTGNDEITGSRRSSTDYQDRVYAGDGADDVSTLEGDDYVEAGGQDDRVCTGPGDDAVLAGTGQDIVCTQTDVDMIVGSGDDETFYSGSGDDSITAGLGSDWCDTDATGDTTTGCTTEGDPYDCDGSDTGAPVECPE